APLGEPRGLLRPHPRAARGDRRRPAGRLFLDARRDRVRRPGDDARAEAPLLVQGRGRPLRHRRPLLRAGAARGEGRDPRRLRPAGGHRARGGGRRGGRRHRPRGDRPALPVPAGPGHGRRECAPHGPAGRHPRGARHRLARLRGDHLRDRGLLRPPRGRPRTGDRLRHALPARRTGGPLPARHRPDPGRRGPHAGPAQLEGGRVMTDFMLPDLGEGLTEATIVAWHVAVGDVVTRNQPIAEVETAKALVELPSPRAGRITALHAAEGETLAVGAPLIALETEAPGGADGGGPAAGSGADDAGSEADDSAAVAAGSGPTAPSPATSDTAASSAFAAGTEQPAPQRQQVLVGYGPMLPGTGRPRRRPRSFETVPYVGRSAEEAARPTPKAMPPVRRHARDLGVDLATVEGTGPGGRILRGDVDACAHGGRKDHGGARGGMGSTPQPVTGLRRETARAMSASAFTAPHASVHTTIDVTDTLERLRRTDRDGRRTSFLAAVCRAIVPAAARTPSANARFDADAGEIELFEQVSLGVAVATERGLVVA